MTRTHRNAGAALLAILGLSIAGSTALVHAAPPAADPCHTAVTAARQLDTLHADTLGAQAAYSVAREQHLPGLEVRLAQLHSLQAQYVTVQARFKAAAASC